MKPRGPHLFVTLVFAGMLLSAGSSQLGLELRQGKTPQLLELFHRVPTVANLRAFEQSLEDQSWLANRLRPGTHYVQFVLFRELGDKALLGHDGWWFYKPGVESVTQRAPAQSVTGDPVAAIVDFRDQLAARGIRLIVMPAPNKESVYPEQLVRRAAHLRSTLSEPTDSLIRKLRAAGVDVVNLFELYGHERRAASPADVPPLYLAQDSHWSPAGLALAARAVADRLVARGWVAPGGVRYHTRLAPTERRGDVVRMLQVPQIEARLAPERVPCVQVIDSDSGRPYQDRADAEILVMGDSFLRIFQQDEPGAAGFIAHLAHELRQPVASIVNDGGASTLVRQDLYRRPVLLQHKKVVIWEFVERDIRQGLEGWQPVPLPPLAEEQNVHESQRPDHAKLFLLAAVCRLRVPRGGRARPPAGGFHET